ncbi:MAG: ATP-binding cassette domain-containing protein [Peptococcaceae bacterium]|jgi:ABC-type lipoprotein export system ATPase subunit|nr:ATP-binding cassette domain-containing protein [Peptococcaceae bacterium]
MKKAIEDLPLQKFISMHPYILGYFAPLVKQFLSKTITLGEWIRSLTDDDFEEVGMDRGQTVNYLQFLIRYFEERGKRTSVKTITVIGGTNKFGEPENVVFHVSAGEIICIVGPTGSGKSQLLADIECIADGDTPTGRKVLLNGQAADTTLRFSTENKLVAQISQNMNFVIDMTVWEFLTMHAQSRMVAQPSETVENMMVCANDLVGEKFSPDMPVTRLSGGQSRALMIADTALLSDSPVILIDEIENAGVDRQKALSLLMKEEKIVFMSTHDPLLAFLGSRRLVIQNGGIAKIIEASAKERDNLSRLQNMDVFMMQLRTRLRRGDSIDEKLYFSL